MEEKNIKDMLRIIKGNIVDKNMWKNGQIDTIVNAAKPTLMGSNQGVDGSIHRAVDEYLKGENTLNKLICSELKMSENDIRIRCERGKALTTSGYGYCNWIIHAVGTPYDGVLDTSGKLLKNKECTSSCVYKIESCYYKIVEEIKKHLDIKVIGIPIIGAGEYNVPFELAAKIAIASVGNALLEWKNQDEEMFSMSSLQEVCFFVFDSDTQKCKQNFRIAEDILMRYGKCFKDGKKVVFQNTLQAHMRYLNEISKYDCRRGYFAIAKSFRWLLMAIRTMFIPVLCIKDVLASDNWERRRQMVEVMTFIKAIIPFFLWEILHIIGGFETQSFLALVFKVLIIYSMLDTITYLLVLIFMADIQRPSANIVRSIIMLFVNYIEIAGDLSFLYYLHYKSITPKFHFREALAYGYLGMSSIKEFNTNVDYGFLFLDNGVKFFFLTLVLGYFFNHIRQRRFRS